MEQEFFFTRLDCVEDWNKPVWNDWRKLKAVCSRRKKIVRKENSVEVKPCINRKSKSLEITI